MSVAAKPLAPVRHPNLHSRLMNFKGTSGAVGAVPVRAQPLAPVRQLVPQPAQRVGVLPRPHYQPVHLQNQQAHCRITFVIRLSADNQ